MRFKKRIIIRLLVLFALFCSINVFSQSTVQIALLKYSGGGDWYANPTSLPNLIRFCNKNIGTNLVDDYATVEVGSPELFNYPFVHMTGHGNVVFSTGDIINLRNYLIGGGFLHIDDNYGMDKFVRREIKRVFPELDFVEIPFDHDIYHQKYNFNNGLPKIHEHEGNPPKGYGLILEGRLICFYSHESDLGDGWEDFEVHKDSDETRLKALRMGANIIQFCFIQ